MVRHPRYVRRSHDQRRKRRQTVAHMGTWPAASGQACGRTLLLNWKTANGSGAGHGFPNGTSRHILITQSEGSRFSSKPGTVSRLNVNATSSAYMQLPLRNMDPSSRMKPLLALAALAVIASVAIGCTAAPPVSPWASYWATALAATAMPASVQRLLSPLSAADATRYEKLIAQGRMLASPALASEFCTAARMLCLATTPDAAVAAAKQGRRGGMCRIRFTYSYDICVESVQAAPTQDEMDTWFFQTDLTSLTVPASLLGTSSASSASSAASPLQQRSFLPRAVVDALGRTSTSGVGRKDLASPSALDPAAVFRQLHLAPDSDVAVASRNEAAAYCSNRNEEGTCVQSAEELADLLASTFHADVDTVAGSSTFPEFFADAGVAGGEMAVVKVELMAGTGDRFVTCHPVAFPYLVLYCHYVPDSKLYLVTLESTAKKGVQVANLVHCHMDTSKWSPNHVSFRVLGTQPGTDHACHWSPLDTLTFLPRTPPT